MDFGEVVKSNVDSKVDWNMIGLCRRQLGEADVSAKAFRRALVIDPKFKVKAQNCKLLLVFLRPRRTVRSCFTAVT